MTIIRFILEPFAFLATAAIMPLAFLELFGTYAWICFTIEKYCGDTTADNEIQKDRNLIKFGFIVCASILFFTSRMKEVLKKLKIAAIGAASLLRHVILHLKLYAIFYY